MTPQVLLSLEPTLPLLHVSVALETGNIEDPPGKEGTTRLLLGLLRRTANGRTADQCDELLDSLGASLGVQVGRNVAAFHGTVISRASERFLNFLDEVLTAPHFEQAEFERTKSEFQAQLVDALDDDSTLVRRFFSRKFFEGHAYSRLPTLSSLSKITLDDIRAQYEKLFTAPALIFAFGGSADEAALSKWAERVSHKLPPSRNAEPSIIEAPRGPQGRILQFVDKPHRSQTQILIGCLGTHPRDEDHIPLLVGHIIFGGTFSARLSQEVRGKRGWSYGAYSNLPLDRQRLPFSLWTFPGASDASACLQLELEMLRHFIERGVSARELSAAKRYLKNSHVFTVDTAEKRLTQMLDTVTLDLPPSYHEELIPRVQAVTRDQIQEALIRRLSYQNLLITVVGTHETIGTEVETAVKAENVQVVPFNSDE